MYESDTCTKLAAAFIILDLCDQLLDQEKPLLSCWYQRLFSLHSSNLYTGQRVIARDDPSPRNRDAVLKQSYLEH